MLDDAWFLEIIAAFPYHGISILYYLLISYMMPSLFCSGVMESTAGDHQEQIGGTGHTKLLMSVGLWENLGFCSDILKGCKQNECSLSLRCSNLLGLLLLVLIYFLKQLNKNFTLNIDWKSVHFVVPIASKLKCYAMHCASLLTNWRHPCSIVCLSHFQTDSQLLIFLCTAQFPLR